MLADYFTKLLQGATFRKFCDAIMNCQLVRPNVYPSDHRSVLAPKRANDQSHTIGMRLQDNQGQNLAESEEMNDLTQPQKKEKQHHHDSHF